MPFPLIRGSGSHNLVIKTKMKSPTEQFRYLNVSTFIGHRSRKYHLGKPTTSSTPVTISFQGNLGVAIDTHMAAWVSPAPKNSQEAQVQEGEWPPGPPGPLPPLAQSGPVGLAPWGRPGWSLTGHLFFHQVLQGQTDGVVFHGAGDKVGHGPLGLAVALSHVPLRGVNFVEMPQRRMDNQII